MTFAERQEMIRQQQIVQRQHLKEQEDFLRNNSKGNLKDIASILENSENYHHALAHKDKLLDFDKNSAQRTQVIDDEQDYYSLANQKWVSNEQRVIANARAEELHKLKHTKESKIVLDLTGRKAYGVTESALKNPSEEFTKLQEQTDFKSDYEIVDAYSLINKPSKFVTPTYISSSSKEKTKRTDQSKLNWDFVKLKVQDEDQIAEEGVSLSMHQPWATLLIKGIKKHEGRSWYTAYRGRLWIHAAGVKPEPEQIEQIEEIYKASLNLQQSELPKYYPTGQLLGCVTLVDCLPQEEYREKYPDGESDSPYVFICENPTEIRYIDMKGSKKLYKLDHQIHQKALKYLRRSLNDNYQSN